MGDWLTLNEHTLTQAIIVKGAESKCWEIRVRWGERINDADGQDGHGGMDDIWPIDTLYRFEAECMRVQMIVRRTQFKHIWDRSEDADFESDIETHLE